MLTRTPQQSRSAEASGRYNLFETYEVRPRLNAPGPLSSPGGSHISLLRYVQFPVQSAKFPASIFREFGGNTLNLFANARAGSRITSLKRQISLYFPAKQGIPRRRRVRR